MKRFFDDIREFREALQALPDSPGRCWACSRATGFMIGFNVHKDFRSFDLPTQGREARITLCPPCSVRYMNSFNAFAARLEGREGPVETWTVEKLLRSWEASQPGATSKRED
jgi:hypothetical protein